MVYRIRLIDTAILLTALILLFSCYTFILRVFPLTLTHLGDYTNEEVSTIEDLQRQYPKQYVKKYSNQELRVSVSNKSNGELKDSFLKEKNVDLNMTLDTDKASTQQNALVTFATAIKDDAIPESAEEINTNKDSISYIYKKGHLISNPNLCPDLGDGVKIIILITTAPEHYQARVAIRLTWGHFGQRSDIALAFVVGTTSNNEAQAHIESESKLYGDLIQGHFVDTYENLTLKTLSMLEWVGRYCYKAHFFLKTDDDMFINVPNLLHFAETKWSDERSIFGSLAKKFTPNRNPNNQYYIPYERFMPSVFPDFTTGPAYLVTMDSVRDLYKHTLHHVFVNLEDVLIAGIIAEDLQIARVGVNGFVQAKINETTCVVKGTYSVHMINYETQFKLWALSMSLEKCP